ncbi:CaiB/BaiF CoA transferase family protein [Bordetella tumulicola]|uniref:CaiB/BaiF CoA transferase family protein n=1 Tax=Bordetella tumulicola TaxID=1649133 RepID=UPI0039EFEB11
MTTGQRTGPLAGLKVIDLATIVAAPSAAALLSDYGAEVIKIELPRVGDGLRNFPPFKDGKSLWWKVVNRDKRLLSLDLRKPRGQEIFKSLLRDCDVLIENFRPGTLEKWGLDMDTLWREQPRLVVLRATAFGQTGPYADRPGFARIFEAMGGMTYITGEPDGAPMHVGFPIGDSIGGLFGALGVMAALWKRAADPHAPGEEIDLSLTEATIKLLDFLPMQYDLLDKSQERSGNVSQYAAPTGVYQTRDGQWVSLSGSTDALFLANCRAIGREDLLSDTRFQGNRNRCLHAQAVNQIFKDWFGAHDLDDVLERFRLHEGTVAPVYSACQMVNDPQVRARAFLQTVPDHEFGEVRMPGVVPRFRNDDCRVSRSGGDMGWDNERILVDQLGLSADQLQELQRDGVI